MNELKILVVDDDTNICELIGLYLKKEGFKVDFAYDGEKTIPAPTVSEGGFAPDWNDEPTSAAAPVRSTAIPPPASAPISSPLTAAPVWRS